MRLFSKFLCVVALLVALGLGSYDFGKYFLSNRLFGSQGSTLRDAIDHGEQPDTPASVTNDNSYNGQQAKVGVQVLPADQVGSQPDTSDTLSPTPRHHHKHHHTDATASGTPGADGTGTDSSNSDATNSDNSDDSSKSSTDQGNADTSNSDNSNTDDSNSTPAATAIPAPVAAVPTPAATPLLDANGKPIHRYRHRRHHPVPVGTPGAEIARDDNSTAGTGSPNTVVTPQYGPNGMAPSVPVAGDATVTPTVHHRRHHRELVKPGTSSGNSYGTSGYNSENGASETPRPLRTHHRESPIPRPDNGDSGNSSGSGGGSSGGSGGGTGGADADPVPVPG